MIKKQKILISLCVVALIAVTVVYFVVIRPMVNKKADINLDFTLGEECYNIGSNYIRVEKDKDGKRKYTNIATGKNYEIPESVQDSSAFTHLMFPSIALENIENLTVHNSSGEYSLYYYNSENPEESTVYLRGFEETPLQEDYSYLMVSARHPVVRSRMTEDTSKAAMYGLDKESDPAWYEITERGGRKYKVYIGDLAPTGDRYYVMVEGQDAIYIADSDLNYLLRSAESYVLPVLSMPTDESEYYTTERFTLSVDEEIFVDVDFLSEKERLEMATSSYYEMLVPANYPVNSANYDSILKKFTGFQGTETLAFGNVSDVLDVETLAQYGLDKPKYRIYYRYSGIDNDIYFSEKQTDEETGESYYYAYSLYFNLVAKVSALTVDFFDWDFLMYVDRPVLAHTNINNVASIRIEGKGVDELFELNSTDTELNVLCKSTGKVYSGDDAMSFRVFYKKMLEINLQDYSESVSTDNMLMKLTITSKAGEVREYIFYATTSGHCYYTINGEGEFYVLRDRIEKILSDATVLAAGGEITSEAT